MAKARRFRGPSVRRADTPPREVELVIDELAAGGDGVGRDASGRVTFVARTAPGDRVRAQVLSSTASYARAELREVCSPGPARRAPACAAFVAGCGGCQWLHVEEAAQRAAKAALVARALRRLAGLELRPILAPAPALRWRRRARLHVEQGQLGLYAHGSRSLVELTSCPQLEAPLERVLPLLAAANPPDGELALAVSTRGEVAVAHLSASWPAARALVGQAGIVGVATAAETFGAPLLELEDGLWLGAESFAQASAEASVLLAELVLEPLGQGQGRSLLELHAGAGTFTRGLVAAGWQVTACDVVAPPRPVPGADRWVCDAAEAVARMRAQPPAAIVLDPPRAGARELMPALAALGAARVVYVSCDPATLARDVEALAARGYQPLWAQPVDAMPQTAHIETVLVLARS